MVVKRNQHRLYEDLRLFFEFPAIRADQEQSDSVQTVTKAHGPLETRTLECRRMRTIWFGQVSPRLCAGRVNEQ
jgi:hypothetical protein